MPFTSNGPSYLDFSKSISNLTIVPVSRINNNIQQGFIYQPSSATVINPVNIEQNTEGTLDNIQTSYESSGPVITDKIYELLGTVLTNLSNPDNIEQTALANNVLPYLDELQAELDKYPNIYNLIMEIQQVFKNITNTLKTRTNQSSNNLGNIVVPQLNYLMTLIERIPTSIENE